MMRNVMHRFQHKIPWDKAIKVMVLIIFGIVSIVCGNRYDPSEKIDKLTEQQFRAATITSVAATASATISVFPDDIGSTLADEIDDVTGYMIVATACIMIERFIVAIAGHISYYYLFPISFGLLIFHVLQYNKRMRGIAVRLLALGICILAVIPLSLNIEDCFNNVLHTDETIEALVQTQEEATQVESGGFWSNVTNAWNKVTGFVSNTVDSLTNLKETIQTLLIGIMDSIAIMLITTLAIPIFCIGLLYLISKTIIRGILLNLPDVTKEDIQGMNVLLQKPGKYIRSLRARHQ